MQKFWMVLMAGCCLSACAPAPVVEGGREGEKAGNQPIYDQQSSVKPGEVLFHQYSYWHREGARILVANRQPFAQGAIFINKGEVLFPASVEAEAWLCSERETYVDPLEGFIARSCFQDRDGDGDLDRVAVAPESRWIHLELSPALAYQKDDIIMPHPGGFRHELAYDGFSQGSLHLSYREYHGDTLRKPVYTQQVSYDITAFPAEIDFRSVRLQILSAGNQTLVYRVLSGFQ